MALTDQHNPALTALLASAFTLAHLGDDSARRGADNTVRYLAAAPILNFDPTETRAMSETAKDGTHYVTDGTYCTCRAKAWCKHGIAHRLKLAELALTDPAGLIRLIVEQAAPAAVDAADVALVVGAEAAIAAAVAAPFDLADDALYADMVAGVALAPAPARPTVTLSAADALVDELYP